MTDSYTDFLESKTHFGENSGFRPLWMPDFLFDFQKALVEWSLLRGRAALFADCGLGKTPMQLVWAQNVVQRTNGRVLIITPLAVSGQTIREGEKFGIKCEQSRDGSVKGSITVTNYERLHLFSADDYIGVVCDESSILKNFDGVRRGIVTEFMKKRPYRLCCTATAAPNDYIELGTTSEALGELGFMDMLGRFFKNDSNTSDTNRKWASHGGGAPKWRFKKHAERAFWRWIASWARAVRRPSDIGFEDGPFILPPLLERQTIVRNTRPRNGQLFVSPAVGLQEQREERRLTIRERCQEVAALVEKHDCSLIWCHLNIEGDTLEEIIPYSIQVKGSDSDEVKQAAIEWFCGHRCICADPLFNQRVKEWLNDQSSIGRNIIRNTVLNDLKNPSAMAANIQPSEDDISPNTTATTRINGKRRQTKLRNGGNGSGLDMPLMRNSARDASARLQIIDAEIQNHELSEHSKNSVSQSRNTDDSLRSVAESAADTLPADSILTIVTQRDNSEDSSAQNAISGLVNSAIVQNVLNGRLCICGHKSGRRKLISKSVMFGYGLNLQNCAHMTTFPSHSFEQYYQAVRRCWRFGQKRPVMVDIVTTEGEATVLDSLQRKSQACDRMFSELVAQMNDVLRLSRSNEFTLDEVLPSWL